jgi:hypothetical protein
MIKYIKKYPASGYFLIIAARQGFEPQFLGPKPSVLPLDDRAMYTLHFGNVVYIALKSIFYQVTIPALRQYPPPPILATSLDILKTAILDGVPATPATFSR